VSFILLSGKPPFMGESKEEVYKAIRETEHAYTTQEWSQISDDAKDFLRICLDKNPETRPSAEALLNHPWLA